MDELLKLLTTMSNSQGGGNGMDISTLMPLFASLLSTQNGNQKGTEKSVPELSEILHSLRAE